MYAVSPGSVAFLESLGAWSALPHDRLTAIESMRIEGDEGAVMTFSAYELGERALAWIVEERELRASLVRDVRDAGVDVLAPGGFARLAFAPDSATLALDDGREIEAKLVVGADGVRSWIRQAAGIIAAPRPYGQTAVVANFACERPHRGCARQWFRADGSVLAWLPLPERRISIVWSAPSALADSLMALDAGDACRSRRWRGRACAGRARAHHATGRVSRSPTCACRRPSPIVLRSSAMPRTACIRWRARA